MAMSFGARFVRDPSLLTSRRPLDPWGGQTLDIHFVGGPYRFTGMDEDGVAAIRDAYGTLCRPSVDGGSGAGAQTITQVLRTSKADFVPDGGAGGEYVMDLAFSPDAVDIAGPRFVARVALEPSLSGVLACAESDTALALLAFHNYFRVLVAYRLLRLGGILLHSAGVVRAGAAYLVLGQSGAGKSTFARMSQNAGLQILSDDLNALLVQADGPVVEKLPFAGSLDRTETDATAYPLGLLGVVRKGPDDRIGPEALRTGDAVAAVVAAAPFVNLNPHALRRLMEVAEAVVRRCAVFPVTFNLGGRFWESTPVTSTAAFGDPHHAR